MLYLFGSISLNALLSVIFKLFDRFEINNLVAIVCNYFVCFLVGWAVVGPSLLDFPIQGSDYSNYLLALALLFITGFNFVALTVQKFSITLATIMQRMSLIAVVLYAVFWYGETLGIWRLLGLILGTVAIVAISSPSRLAQTSQQDPKQHKKAILFLLPLFTFLISSAIDCVFYRLNRTGITQNLELEFSAYAFLAAGLLGLLVLLYHMFANGVRIRLKDIIAGIVLGLPNFFSIYCIQMMLFSDMDGSVVFPINNVGILMVSAMASILLFGEKFTTIKWIGLAAALISIFLLSKS